VTADPTVDDSLTVDEVQFFLGDRLVCTDDTGPSYTCDVLANGDEVGPALLRAVVTDSAAQTAQDTEGVTVDISRRRACRSSTALPWCTSTERRRKRRGR